MWKVKSVFLIIINQNRKFTSLRIKSKILELYQKQIENYVGIWVDINITKVSVYTRYILNLPRMLGFFFTDEPPYSRYFPMFSIIT